MEKQIVHSQHSGKEEISFIRFWILTTCHYLSGMGGIIACTILATTADVHTKNISAIASVICIIIFALFKPDLKYRKVDTDWNFLIKNSRDRN